MQHILYLAKVVAPTEMTVIIEGETGSGKEYLARKIHQNSRRSNAPFIAIDCGAIPSELAGSELFGHIKGAFTGAIKDKTGYFEQAKNGTVFLDEIGNLSPEIQMKLLRAIQERIITKIGDNKQIKTDMRILVAANEDMKEITEKGKFRKDLYHRLNEFKITIPPLRERADDIMFYANHFLNEANRLTKSNIIGFQTDVEAAFLKYPWYGNLRELKNVVKRAVLLSENSLIKLSTLPEEIRYYVSDKIVRPESKDNSYLKNAAIEAEREVITDALKVSDNNKTRAAQLLNIDRKTLYNKMKRLGLFPES
jgi:two-component system response regulator HydG